MRPPTFSRAYRHAALPAAGTRADSAPPTPRDTRLVVRPTTTATETTTTTRPTFSRDRFRGGGDLCRRPAVHPGGHHLLLAELVVPHGETSLRAARSRRPTRYVRACTPLGTVYQLSLESQKRGLPATFIAFVLQKKRSYSEYDVLY